VTVPVRHPEVDQYLRALDDAVRPLPRRERDELVMQVTEHIHAALPPQPTGADVRNVLDGLGSPADIAAAAGVKARTVRRGAREAFALVLLVTGLPPLIGWVVGLGLLLWSPLWSARQKLLGALVWPGGWFFAFVFGLLLPTGAGSTISCVSSAGQFAASCTTTHSGPPAWMPALIVAALFLAPIFVAAYLWREAGRRSATYELAATP